ncbi:MAG TPA: hypothetical protein DD732_02925 [Rhizobiales bacterium]|jgi:hypothetical protein|nr:hypothetical protein [Hyphomicrobiales bacterium]
MAGLKEFMAQNLPKAVKWAGEHKAGLAAGAAGLGGAAVVGAKGPKAYDDFMTDQAVKSMKRKGKRALDTAGHFVEDHPVAMAGLAGVAGARAASGGLKSIMDLLRGGQDEGGLPPPEMRAQVERQLERDNAPRRRR